MSISSTTTLPGRSLWRGPLGSKCPFWLLCAGGQEERWLLTASVSGLPTLFHVSSCSCPPGDAGISAALAEQVATWATAPGGEVCLAPWREVSFSIKVGCGT